MKYIVVLGDGMADRPLKELSGKTPLEIAHKPAMDYVSRNGKTGLLRTLRDDMPLGSDIANLSVLGYDPRKYYPGGRGPLEAAAMGISLDAGDIAFRANLVTAEKERMKDYSGGHISSIESKALIDCLNKEYADDNIRFYPGVGYRHIMVLKNSDLSHEDFIETPPHDITGRLLKGNYIKPANKGAESWASKLNDIMNDSTRILSDHPINKKRAREGKEPANMVWFWGGGTKPAMPSFKELYGVSGAVISAVDLLRGIAVYAGLAVVNVPGATGYLDTDYAAKAEYALESLRDNDFVYIHVEAPDEAGHEGLVKEKVKAIEEIDEKIVARILKEMKGQEYRLAVLPDHATPIEAMTHTSEPVPFAI